MNPYVRLPVGWSVGDSVIISSEGKEVTLTTLLTRLFIWVSEVRLLSLPIAPTCNHPCCKGRTEKLEWGGEFCGGGANIEKNILILQNP